MEFTINCTRVPIPQGTTLYGITLDEGSAPAKQGPVSDNDVLHRNPMMVMSSIQLDGYHLIQRRQLPKQQYATNILAVKLTPFSAHSMPALLFLWVDWKN